MPNRFCAFICVPFLLAATLASAQAAPTTAPAFPLRVVELGGHVGDPAVRAHVEFSLAAGFNALWVPSDQAGRWIAAQDPDAPRLLPEFVQLARWCAERNVRVFVALAPERESDDLFVYGDKRNRDSMHKFALMLRRQAGVRDFVLDFRGAAHRLVDLGDALRFGASSAPAHVDTASWLRRKLRRRGRVWLAPAVDNAADLELHWEGYGSPLVTELRSSDPNLGIVWSGPSRRPVSIEGSDIVSARTRMGGRPLLLRDGFLVNGDGSRMALSLLLPPLRGRDPDIAGAAAGYLVAPMTQLGASRLSLRTVADYLRAPTRYDADSSWKSAMERLGGDDPRALEALKTQGLEWGGWIGGLNYKTARDDNPAKAAADLRDPAAVSAWRWPARRYPSRMADLSGLRDTVFRDDLLDTMRRRLSVARAVPLVVSLRGSADPLPWIKQLQSERRRVADQTGAREALDCFLAAAGVLDMLIETGPRPSHLGCPGERQPRPETVPGGSAW